MKPDLRQLQALVAIAAHGSLARAADTLACSPSALSMQLSALQQRVNLTLLRRTGRGLALTPEGELLLPAAREAVAAVARLGQLAESTQLPMPKRAAAEPARLPVVVGTILDPAAIRLGEFLRAVRQRGPHIHPELRHGISGQVLKEVGHFHYHIVVPGKILFLLRVNAYPVEDIIMQREKLSPVLEIPIQRFRIINLVQKFNFEVFGQCIGNGVEF